MKVQYNLAKINNGIIVGTDHAAESVTGFFTKFEDGGSNINPISELNKNQGKLLLKELQCPAHIYLKSPKSHLEDHYPYKTDEKILGVSYLEIDAYLEEIPINYIYNSKKIIENYYLKTLHKRKTPITPYSFYKKLKYNEYTPRN